MAENKPNFDLHLHTDRSDGGLSPEEVVSKCKELGLEYIALTDHESVKGIPEALAAGERLGIKVIPGIEISCDYQGKEEHHILGYFINYKSRKLEDFLKEWRKTKIAQLKGIVEKLQGLGFEIELEKVLNQAKDVPARTHISDVIFLSSFNLDLLRNPPKEWGVEEINNKRKFFKVFLKDCHPLKDEAFRYAEGPSCLTTSSSSLSERVSGGMAFVDRERPPIEEVLNLISEIGGMSIWAHPFWKDNTIEQIKEEAASLKQLGLNGLEVLYSFYKNPEQVYSLHNLAQELGMMESGGSDFHDIVPDFLDKIADFKTYGIEINFPFERLGG